MKSQDAVARAVVLSAIAALLISCPPPVWETFDLLTFPDFAGYRGVMGGQLGEVEFGDVLVGENEPYVLRMQNSSSQPLTIDRISFDSIHYDFYDHVSPAFPLTLAAGEATDMLCLGFYPQVNGALSGRVVFEVGDRIVYLGLGGNGVWKLTLSIATDDGRILSPSLVGSAAADVTFLSSDGIVSLSAEADDLMKFETWTVLDSPKVQPEFPGDAYNAEDVTITLHAHTHIEASFYNPYNFFPAAGQGTPEFADLQAAINDCTVTAGKDAVIVQAGVHDIGTPINVPAGVSLFGGYTTDLATRDYQTAAVRASITNRAILRFTDAGEGLTIASSAGPECLIEGITVTRASADPSPVLTIASGAKPVIRYVTLTAVGPGPALRSNGGSPTIRHSAIAGGNSADSSTGAYLIGGAPYLEYNTIASGNTTANYSETRALHLEDSCHADLFKNTITAGTAGGTGSESFGMFVDFGSRPLVVGNAIGGGSATGSGGMSNGIYFINNGSATLRYNDIDGGTGALMSRALYSAYGTNFYVRGNNFSVGSGSGSGYGVYLGTNGRVRRFGGNGFSEDVGVFQYTYLTDEEVDDIDDLNEIYLSGFLAFFGTTVEGGTNVVGTVAIPADYALGERE